jgi:hypothetical protein
MTLARRGVAGPVRGLLLAAAALVFLVALRWRQRHRR